MSEKSNRGSANFSVMDMGSDNCRNVDQGLSKQPHVEDDLRPGRVEKLDNDLTVKELDSEGLVYKGGPSPDRQGRVLSNDPREVRANTAEIGLQRSKADLDNARSAKGREAKSRKIAEDALSSEKIGHSLTKDGLNKERERSSRYHDRSIESEIKHSEEQIAHRDTKLAATRAREEATKKIYGLENKVSRFKKIGIPLAGAATVGSYLLGRHQGEAVEKGFDDFTVKELDNGIVVEKGVKDTVRYVGGKFKSGYQKAQEAAFRNPATTAVAAVGGGIAAGDIANRIQDIRNKKQTKDIETVPDTLNIAQKQFPQDRDPFQSSARSSGSGQKKDEGFGGFEKRMGFQQSLPSAPGSDIQPRSLTTNNPTTNARNPMETVQAAATQSLSPSPNDPDVINPFANKDISTLDSGTNLPASWNKPQSFASGKPIVVKKGLARDIRQATGQLYQVGKRRIMGGMKPVKRLIPSDNYRQNALIGLEPGFAMKGLSDEIETKAYYEDFGFGPTLTSDRRQERLKRGLNIDERSGRNKTRADERYERAQNRKQGLTEAYHDVNGNYLSKNRKKRLDKLNRDYGNVVDREGYAHGIAFPSNDVNVPDHPQTPEWRREFRDKINEATNNNDIRKANDLYDEEHAHEKLLKDKIDRNQRVMNKANERYNRNIEKMKMTPAELQLLKKAGKIGGALALGGAAIYGGKKLYDKVAEPETKGFDELSDSVETKGTAKTLAQKILVGGGVGAGLGAGTAAATAPKGKRKDAAIRGAKYGAIGGAAGGAIAPPFLTMVGPAVAIGGTAGGLLASRKSRRQDEVGKELSDSIETKGSVITAFAGKRAQKTVKQLADTTGLTPNMLKNSLGKLSKEDFRKKFPGIIEETEGLLPAKKGFNELSDSIETKDFGGGLVRGAVDSAKNLFKRSAPEIVRPKSTVPFQRQSQSFFGGAGHEAPKPRIVGSGATQPSEEEWNAALRKKQRAAKPQPEPAKVESAPPVEKPKDGLGKKIGGGALLLGTGFGLASANNEALKGLKSHLVKR